MSDQRELNDYLHDVNGALGKMKFHIIYAKQETDSLVNLRKRLNSISDMASELCSLTANFAASTDYASKFSFIATDAETILHLCADAMAKTGQSDGQNRILDQIDSMRSKTVERLTQFEVDSIRKNEPQHNAATIDSTFNSNSYETEPTVLLLPLLERLGKMFPISLSFQPGASPLVVADESEFRNILEDFFGNLKSAFRPTDSPQLVLSVHTIEPNGVFLDVRCERIDTAVIAEPMREIFEPFELDDSGATVNLAPQNWRSRLRVWGADVMLIEKSPAFLYFRFLLRLRRIVPLTGNKQRALVVDDEEFWIQRVTNVLGDYDVVSASSHDEAIKRVTTGFFALVVLDLKIPVQESGSPDIESFGEGLNLAANIREKFPGVIIILMTAFYSSQVVKEALYRGVDDVMDKTDFQPGEFTRSIIRLLGRREAQKDSFRESELSTLISNFLKSLLHELRTPVSNIDMVAERLDRTGGSQIKGDIGKIKRACRTAHKLIEGHLRLYRLELGLEKLRNEECDLLGIVRTEVEYFRDLWPDKSIQVSSPVHSCMVRIDIDCFRLALNPILENAARFAPENTGVLIEIMLRPEVVEITVIDQGVGVGREDLNDFYSFSRGAEDISPRISNSGIGLGITRRILNLYHGNLEIGPGEDMGTKAQLVLPLKVMTIL